MKILKFIVYLKQDQHITTQLVSYLNILSYKRYLNIKDRDGYPNA